MIRCDNCGTENLDGSDYCDECGTKLDVVIQSSIRPDGGDRPLYEPPRSRAGGNGPAESYGAKDRPSQRDDLRAARPFKTIEGPPPSPPSFTTSTAIPKPARPARPPIPPRVNEPRADRKRPDSGARPAGPASTLVMSSRVGTDSLKARDSSGAVMDLVTAKLVIGRGGRIGKEFPITSVETLVGRWDADSGIFPDVDLDQDDPEAKVSRRHARIVNQNGQYFVEDLGSTNGTFVNRGRRLLPGHRHILQNGDEIIVGKTFLKFQIA